MALPSQILKTSKSGDSTTSPSAHYPHSEEVFANALCYTICHCQEECNPDIFVATLQTAIKLPLSLPFSMLNEPTLPLRLPWYVVCSRTLTFLAVSCWRLSTVSPQVSCRRVGGNPGQSARVWSVTKDSNNLPWSTGHDTPGMCFAFFAMRQCYCLILWCLPQAYFSLKRITRKKEKHWNIIFLTLLFSTYWVIVWYLCSLKKSEL